MVARVIGKAWGVVCVSLALAACGGGGGGGSDGSGGGGGGGGSGQFTVTPSSLTFTAPATGGTMIGSQQLRATISGVSPQTLFLNVQVTGNAVARVGDITITGATTGTANVYPASQLALGPGSYSSVITVIACTTNVSCTSGVIGNPQTVNVTYTVNGMRSSAGGLSYQVGDPSVPEELTRTFDVTGYPVQNWTVQSTVPWLTVDPASGNSAASTRVTATLNTSVLNTYESGTYTGAVTLTGAGDPVSIPVSMQINRTSVNYVAPYVSLTGTAQDVVIRGENLTRTPVTGVRFGAHDAVSFTVVSATEIRARYPALASGSYDVTVVNGQTPSTRAFLRVVDPHSYAFSVFEYPDTPPVAIPVCMVHDPERDSLLVGMLFPNQGVSSSHLLRYSLTANNVAADVAIPYLGACALTTDGRNVLTGTLETADSNRALYVSELDPLTLASQRRTRQVQAWSFEARGMAPSNNGRTIITTGVSGSSTVQVYSQLRPQLSSFSDLPSTDDGTVAASSDGSTVLLGSAHSALPPIMRYDSDNNRLINTSLVRNVTSIGLNRTGDRALLDYTQVYDRDLQLLSSLPATTRAAALAPNSRRAYTYDNNGTVRVFDVSSAAVGTFPEILPAITLAEGPGTANLYRILVSHDEAALFIAGSEQVVVVPLP